MDDCRDSYWSAHLPYTQTAKGQGAWMILSDRRAPRSAADAYCFAKVKQEQIVAEYQVNMESLT